MSYELKKAEGRLENIRKVKPILAALRTISLGSWQMARNRRAGLTAFTDRLLELLPVIVPAIADRREGRRRWWVGRRDEPKAADRAAVLIVGAERGLCGRYNKPIIETLERFLREELRGWEVEVGALGTRLTRELRLAGFDPTWQKALSITALPRYEFAYDLAADWLRRFEGLDLDSVYVVYNADRGAGNYAPDTVRLIPPEVPQVPQVEPPGDARASGLRPSPIVETDPMRLYVRVVEQWTAIALYRLLLEAAATEHSARFQLMESATQNADELVDDLMLTVNSARRQAITREMQELAISAGLLGET